MNDSKLAAKVGLFVILGAGLLVALVLVFSKGWNAFGDTYALRLQVRSVAGLTEHSSVLMSGVKIGSVRRIELHQGGRGVVLVAAIDKNFQIHADAQFVIEQIGFLGDQFVSIYPRENTGPILQDNAEVIVEQPFNMQQAARSAMDLVAKISSLVDNVNQMVQSVSTSLLNENILTNAAVTVGNLRVFSDRALGMVDAVDALVATNSPSISFSVSNLVRFSGELEILASELAATVSTNRDDLSAAVRNLEQTSGLLKGLAQGVDSGQGVVGSLLRDVQMQGNLTQTVSNLNILSSNLTKYGLLYKPKKRKEQQPASAPVYPGRSPF